MKNPYLANVFHLAWTMILCNITVPLLGMVDTMMMGHLKQSYYLAAIGMGAAIFDFLLWGFGFLRMGTTGLVAQAFGQCNGSEMRLIVTRAMLLAGIIALLLLLFQLPLIHLLLFFLQPSPELQPYILRYLHLRMWAAPATLANAVALGWFIGMQNTRIPLLIVVCMNGVGIFCDVLFVYGFHLTITGLALANIIAQYSGLLLSLYLIGKLLRRYPSNWHWHKVFNKEKIRALLQLNKNIFLRTLCLIFVFAFFISRGARQGNVILAANLVLMNFQMLMSFGLDGFVTATEALVGRTVGAGERKNFLLSIKASLLWTSLIALLFVSLYFFFGQQLIHLLTSIKAVQRVAMDYLPYVILSPVISVWGFLFDGIFIGSTKSKEMLQTMFASLIVFVVVWFSSQSLGNAGLWLAFLSFMLMRSTSMLWMFVRLYQRDQFIPTFPMLK